MKYLVVIGLGLLLTLENGIPAHAKEYIPLIPYPRWFLCKYDEECIAIEGSCKKWLAANREFKKDTKRYYDHWRGKVDCEDASGNLTKAPVKCFNRKCVFK